MLPDLVEIGITKTTILWYTDTINNDFIVDYAPNKRKLLVVTEGSGHGFKFLPVLGNFVVDVIEGRNNEYTENSNRGFLPNLKILIRLVILSWQKFILRSKIK